MAGPPPTNAELTRLQEQIQKLTICVEVLAHQRKDNSPNPQPQEESDNEDNSFGITEQEEELQRLLKLPEFHGGQSDDELVDWIFTVEEILEFKRIPLERCVPLITVGFRGKAAVWWTQLKTSRARLGKPKILSWETLKKKMRKVFLPLNYSSKVQHQLMLQRLQNLRQGGRSVEEYSKEFFGILRRVDLHNTDQQIVECFIGGLRKKFRHTLNLFSPLTIAEAHQKALTIEAQDKENFWWVVVQRCVLGFMFIKSLSNGS